MEKIMSAGVNPEDERLKTYRAQKRRLSGEIGWIMSSSIGDIIVGEVITRIVTILAEYYSDPDMEDALRESYADEELVVPVVQFIVNDKTERTDGFTEAYAYVLGEPLILPPFEIKGVDRTVAHCVDYIHDQLQDFIYYRTILEVDFTGIEDGKLFRIKANGPLGRNFKKYYADNMLKIIQSQRESDL